MTDTPDRSTVYRSADPVVRILGPGVGRDGPFGVLGLPVADLDDAAVVHAVHRAMATIDGHPESRTPAADEARLAVHAAAANLLDAGVRAALLARLCIGGQRSATPKADARASSGDPAARSLQLEADILRAIGASGGWGPAARDRFFKLAHARGVDAHDAVASIHGLAGAIGGGPARSAPAPTRSVSPVPMARSSGSIGAGEPRAVPGTDRDDTDDHSADHSAVRSVLAVCAIVVLMVLAGGITLMIVKGDPPAPITTRAQAPPPRGPSGTEQEGATPDLVVSNARILDNGPAVVYALEAATEGLGVDPNASFDEYAVAVESLAERWGGFAVSDRVAAQDLIVGYMYRVSGRRVTVDRALGAITAGLRVGVPLDDLPGRPITPEQVWRSSWSLGTLVRLRRESNLPSALLRSIDGAVAGASGRLPPNASTFRAGAVAGLRRLGDPLSDGGLAGAPVETWLAWVEAVREAAAGDEPLGTSMLIAALDGRLRHGQRTASGDARVIAALAGSLEWSEGSSARAWLVRAFDDRSLGIDELHAVTLGLASESAAGGVNHSMVLPRGAGDYDRRVLRDRFRELWGIAENADQGVTLAEFARMARDAVAADVRAAVSDSEAMASIVRTARLNAAAAMLWRAETDAAAALLADLDGPIEAVLGSEGVPDLDGLFATGGGTWAEEYLSAGAHIQRRSDLLRAALGRSGRLGAMEAEVIVAEALRGSPLKIRDGAAAIVEAEAGEATIVNAVLEALPLMPRTDRNALIVEIVAGVPLPNIDAGTWDTEARRAVVERLLELIAGHGEYARIDGLAGLLDAAYSERLGTPGGTAPPEIGAESSGSPALILPADDAALALGVRWIASAERRPPASLEGMSIDAIRGRRAARLSAADGLVQVFHAEQLALAEAMAQVVAGEVVGRAGLVEGVLDEMLRGRARARGVLPQIEHTERMMLSLWLLRFGEVGFGGGQG